MASEHDRTAASAKPPDRHSRPGLFACCGARIALFALALALVAGALAWRASLLNLSSIGVLAAFWFGIVLQLRSASVGEVFEQCVQDAPHELANRHEALVRLSAELRSETHGAPAAKTEKR